MANLFPPVSDQIGSLKEGKKETWDYVCGEFEQGLVAKTQMILNESSLGGKINAQDLVQETMLKAWKYRRSFQGETTAQFSGWLITILRNHFYDRCGSLSRDISIVSWSRSAPDSAASVQCVETPSYHAMNEEQAARLHRGLCQLKPDARRIVEMRGLEGMKYREVAEMTGQSISTVAEVYQRSIKQLSVILGEFKNER